MANTDMCTITRRAFGSMPDGSGVELLTLRNRNGMTVTLSTFGATVVSIMVPDKRGVMGDVALGFDTLAGYIDKSNPFLGATIGRYANRIARGKFVLNGKSYSLATNNGVNHLHGGPGGFDKCLWTVAAADESRPSVTMSYNSPDGEEGYPGTMKVEVVFSLSDSNELRFDYRAVSDADTIVNLTNHTYFNLNCQGDILDHLLWINAKSYTPIDNTQIPTGELCAVEGTPFDFTLPERIGARINRVDDIQIVNGSGYDHNYVLEGDGSLARVAAVFSEDTGRLLEVFTTELGVQFYSGNFLEGAPEGKGGVIYRKRSGLCLETQHFPDSPNQPSFPSVVLRAKDNFMSTTIYRLSVADGIS